MTSSDNICLEAYFPYVILCCLSSLQHQQNTSFSSLFILHLLFAPVTLPLSVTAIPMPCSPPCHICPALLPSHSSSWKYNLIPSKKLSNSQYSSFSFTLRSSLKALIRLCSVSCPPSALLSPDSLSL